MRTDKAKNIAKVAINEIKLNPNNPRLIKDEKFAKLVESVKSFPEMLEIRPIVVNKDMIILGGNMRYKACKEAGLKEIPVIVADNLTEEQEKEFLIKDNVSGGEWDWDILANEWDTEELVEWGVDVPEYTTEEVEAQEDDFDEAPPETPFSVLGDLYEIGSHRLLCGDSTDVKQVEKLMNGEKADMVFTDPPYGYKYESNHQNKHKELMNDDKILDFLPNVFLYSKENVAIYIFCGWQTISEWIKQINVNSFDLKNIIIWKKNNWSMGDLKGAYAGQYEVILFVHKGRIELKNGRGQDIWEFDRVPPKEHPTMKPIELIEKALKDTTEQNELVLDLFLGSGSTMVASHQLKRKCYGMELDCRYTDVIVKRMHKLDPTLTIKRNGETFTIPESK